MTSTAVATRPERECSYVPFGQKERIELTIAMVKRFLIKPTKKGVLPTDEQVVRFMMLCKARLLDPWQGDAFCVGYDTDKGPEFSLITAHQAFLKRAEPHIEYDGMQSGVIVRDAQGEVRDRTGDFIFDDDVLLGGWAIVYFKTRKFPMVQRLKLAAFYKDNQFWKRDPAGMICKCAEAGALRMSFPNTLGGMFLEQEIEAGVVNVGPPVGRQSFRPNGTKAIEHAAAAETVPIETAKQPEKVQVGQLDEQAQYVGPTAPGAGSGGNVFENPPDSKPSPAAAKPSPAAAAADAPDQAEMQRDDLAKEIEEQIAGAELKDLCNIQYKIDQQRMLMHLGVARASRLTELRRQKESELVAKVLRGKKRGEARPG